jgi:hypothetical protein
MTSHAPDSATGDAPAPTSALPPATSIAVETCRDAQDRISRLAAEAVTFLGRRLQADRAVLKSLAAAGTPQDAALVWARFLDRAMTDYSGEIELMSAICVAPPRPVRHSGHGRHPRRPAPG